jgi:hypothetical protein
VRAHRRVPRYPSTSLHTREQDEAQCRCGTALSRWSPRQAGLEGFLPAVGGLAGQGGLKWRYGELAAVEIRYPDVEGQFWWGRAGRGTRRHTGHSLGRALNPRT